MPDTATPQSNSTQAPWNPVDALFKKYPGMENDYPDSHSRAVKYLSDPGNFRREFPEFTGLSDEEIPQKVSQFAPNLDPRNLLGTKPGTLPQPGAIQMGPGQPITQVPPEQREFGPGVPEKPEPYMGLTPSHIWEAIKSGVQSIPMFRDRQSGQGVPKDPLQQIDEASRALQEQSKASGARAGAAPPASISRIEEDLNALRQYGESAVPILGPMAESLVQRSSKGDVGGLLAEGATDYVLLKGPEKLTEVSDAINKAFEPGRITKGQAKIKGALATPPGPKGTRAAKMESDIGVAKRDIATIFRDAPIKGSGSKAFEDAANKIADYRQDLWESTHVPMVQNHGHLIFDNQAVARKALAEISPQDDTLQARAAQNWVTREMPKVQTLSDADTRIRLLNAEMKTLPDTYGPVGKRVRQAALEGLRSQLDYHLYNDAGEKGLQDTLDPTTGEVTERGVNNRYGALGNIEGQLRSQKESIEKGEAKKGIIPDALRVIMFKGSGALSEGVSANLGKLTRKTATGLLKSGTKKLVRTSLEAPDVTLGDPTPPGQYPGGVAPDQPAWPPTTPGGVPPTGPIRGLLPARTSGPRSQSGPSQYGITVPPGGFDARVPPSRQLPPGLIGGEPIRTYSGPSDVPPILQPPPDTSGAYGPQAAYQHPPVPIYEGEHHSNTANLSVLAGSKRGSSRVGAEGVRLRKGTGAPAGSYFYDKGAVAEPMIGIRQHTYIVRGPKNIATIEDTPLWENTLKEEFLKAKNAGRNDTDAHHIAANEAERKLMGSGFDGYRSKLHPGITFLFGDNPVSELGKPTKGKGDSGGNSQAAP